MLQRWRCYQICSASWMRCAPAAQSGLHRCKWFSFGCRTGDKWYQALLASYRRHFSLRKRCLMWLQPGSLRHDLLNRCCHGQG